MLTQILTKSLTFPNLLAAFLPSDAQPIRACSRDYGFDFDNEEIARDLITPLPANLDTQSTPEVTADEFESLYLLFVS